MKFIVKLVVLAVVIAAVVNYIAYQKTGNIPAREWLASFKKSANEVVNKEESPAPKNTVKISKWTDANGVVHYENRPVDDAQTLEVDPDANVLPPMPNAELPKDEPKAKTMDEEIKEIQEAKRAHFDALTQ